MYFIYNISSEINFSHCQCFITNRPRVNLILSFYPCFGKNKNGSKFVIRCKLTVNGGVKNYLLLKYINYLTIYPLSPTYTAPTFLLRTYYLGWPTSTKEEKTNCFMQKHYWSSHFVEIGKKI